MKKQWIKTLSIAMIVTSILIGIVYSASMIITKKNYSKLKESVIIKNEDETKEKQNTMLEKKAEEKKEESMEKEEIIPETVPEAAPEIVPEAMNDEKVETIKEYIKYSSSTEIDFEQLKTINSDYKGWLLLPDTEISYPVPQGPDNEYYLHRNFETKQYEYSGTLYIDAFSSKMANQDHLIIYGHNMRNNTMFGTLKQFKDTKYFKDHPYIEFHTKEEKRVYLVFAVRVVKADMNSLDYALSDFDIEEYKEKAIEKSVQSRNIDLKDTEFKQIITLSTCVGNSAKRLLVSGIRIK